MMSKIISVFSPVVELAVCMAVSFNALHNVSQSQLTSDVLAYILGLVVVLVQDSMRYQLNIRLRLCVWLAKYYTKTKVIWNGATKVGWEVKIIEKAD